MSDASDLPPNNEGWFKRHIITTLDDLKSGHAEMIRQQRNMHETNVRRMDEISKTLQDHSESDQSNFSKLKNEIDDLQTPKRIVYGFTAMILVAFMAALITMVISKR